MGPAGSGHPKRFYHFGLLDPLNDPRATFRWYYRSWSMFAITNLFELADSYC
jgi:hypothetical protein